MIHTHTHTQTHDIHTRAQTHTHTHDNSSGHNIVDEMMMMALYWSRWVRSRTGLMCTTFRYVCMHITSEHTHTRTHSHKQTRWWEDFALRVERARHCYKCTYTDGVVSSSLKYESSARAHALALLLQSQSRNMCLALNTLLGYTLERGSGSLTCCSSIFIYVFHREYKKTFSVLGIITQLCLKQSICTESRTLTHIY